MRENNYVHYVSNTAKMSVIIRQDHAPNTPSEAFPTHIIQFNSTQIFLWPNIHGNCPVTLLRVDTT